LAEDFHSYKISIHGKDGHRKPFKDEFTLDATDAKDAIIQFDKDVLKLRKHHGPNAIVYFVDSVIPLD
jgi:hypothetical protein